MARRRRGEAFERAGRRPPLARFRRVPIRLLAPNLVTLLALCSGLTAIRMAIDGRFEVAIAAIGLAAALDAVDGRLARLLKSTSRFGAELDSLADFVNFGVAPGIVLYLWILDRLGSLGWIAVLVLAVACALRLARFNVAVDHPDTPHWAVDFFFGVPAPAGALSALLPLYVEFLGLPHYESLAPVVLVYVVGVAVLMTSRVPTFSGKRVAGRVPRELVLPVLGGAVLTVALFASFPWTMLTLSTLLYFATIPFAVMRHRRLAQAAQAPVG